MTEEYLTEDEQLEAFKRWTTENGAWAVGGVVLGLALLFGWRYYDNFRNERDFKAAAQFGAMTEALDRNDRNSARRIADGIVKGYASTPYADQAELALARMSMDEGNAAAAAAALRQVMTGSKDTELQNIARLRLARVLIDAGKPDEALQTLAEAPGVEAPGVEAPGAAAPGAAAPAAGSLAAPFASRYHAVRGDALYAKKDRQGALREYQAALTSGGAPPGDASLLQLKIMDLGGAAAPAIPEAKP